MVNVLKIALIWTGLYTVYLMFFTMLIVVIHIFGKLIVVFFFLALAVLTFGHFKCGARIMNVFRTVKRNCV